MKSISKIWLVGIDEIATGTQACDGWTYFALPEDKVEEFESRGRNILKNKSLNVFHGKKYKKEHKKEFTNFLELIRETLEDDGLYCTKFYDGTYKKKLENHFKKLFSTVAKGIALIDIHGDAEKIEPYAPIVSCAFHALEPLGPNVAMKVHMDGHSSLKDLGRKPERVEIGYVGTMQWKLERIANHYRRKKFPKAPYFSDYPIEVMKDSDSMMIQAADVLGNFILGRCFIKLGGNSKKHRMKNELLEEVFGEMFDKFNFSALKLDGNDFILQDQDVCLTHRIKRSQPDE